MSAVSRIPATAPSSARRVIVASLIGTSLEWYDFFIYGTAAALIFNKIFFPVSYTHLTLPTILRV